MIKTEKFKALPSTVGVVFSKTLTDQANEIRYEGRADSEKTAVAFVIEQLVVTPGDGLAQTKKDFNTYLKGFTAKLVLFYGDDGGVLPKPPKPQGIEINRSKKTAFIYWRVESVAVLESVANSTHRSKKLFVQVELLATDDLFDARKKSGKAETDAYAIALSFE
jgi:hypothetical protein